MTARIAFVLMVAIAIPAMAVLSGDSQSVTRPEPAPPPAPSGDAANAGTPGPTAAAATAKRYPGYRIGAGDVLQILVWKEPDASVPSVVVPADGKISLPLIKEVEVAGLTPSELETLLAAKFARFIQAADVTVVAKEINSKRIYMVGSVKKEGPIPLLSALTVLQAINEAGGITEYGKASKIYILRNENGRQIRIPFDYKAVIKGEHPEQNIQVLPDDMIVVP